MQYVLIGLRSLIALVFVISVVSKLRSRCGFSVDLIRVSFDLIRI